MAEYNKLFMAEYNREFALQNVRKNPYAILHTPLEFRDDEEIVTAVVSKDASLLRFASDRLRDKPEVVLAAMGDGVSSLHLASERLQNDKEFVLGALRSRRFEKDANKFLRILSDSLLDDKEIVLEILRQTGDGVSVLMSVSRRMQDDKDVVLEAILANGMAIRYASRRLANDKDIAKTAVKTTRVAYTQLFLQLQRDRDFVKELLISDPFVIEYIHYTEWIYDLELARIVLKSCPACKYFSEPITKIVLDEMKVPVGFGVPIPAWEI